MSGSYRPGTKTRLQCRRSDLHVLEGVCGWHMTSMKDSFDLSVNPHHGGCLFKLLRSGMEDMIWSLALACCCMFSMLQYYYMGGFLKLWYPHNTPKWSFLVGKPMVVGKPTILGNPHIDTLTMTSYRSSLADSVSLCCYVLVSPSSAWRISIRRAFMQQIIFSMIIHACAGGDYIR